MLVQLLEHDVSLAQAVHVLAQQQDPIAEKVYILMHNGNTFSRSLIQTIQKTHSLSIYFSMLEASEKTGTLIPVLQNICKDIESNQSTRSRLVGTLCYPSAVILLACIGTLFLVFKGIPIMEQQGFIEKEDVANMLGHIAFSFLILICLGASFIWFYLYLMQKESVNSRLFFMLHLLTTAGIPLDNALSYCLPVIRQTKARKAIVHAKEQILEGKTLSAACENTNFFPKTLITWLVIAGKQGSAQEIFKKIALFYGKQDETRKDRIQRFCEPVIILITGIYIAILLEGTVLPLLTNFGGL